VKYLIALLGGAATGVIAVLLHQSFPPVGVLAAMVFSYLAIKYCSQQFGRRIYKWIAATGWIAVILRGSTFGEGQELLVQADGVGSTLLLLGTFIVLAAVAARV
jgi:hypothetical protein